MSKTTTTTEKTTGLNLLRNPIARPTTVKMMYLWVAVNMIYYAFALGDLEGSLIVNNLINGVCEIVPIVLLASIVDQKWFMRSKFLAILLILTSIAALSCSVCFEISAETGDMSEILGRLMAFVGRACVSAAFALVYVFACEVFPTNVRSSGVGMCSMAGRVGAIIAPQIAKLGLAPISIGWLPGVIFTVVGIAGALIRYTVNSSHL